MSNGMESKDGCDEQAKTAARERTAGTRQYRWRIARHVSYPYRLKLHGPRRSFSDLT
jgi:hypothetical protein